MPSPFPGMDPWLERPGLWPDVHDSLILALRKNLTPLLRPRYYVAVRQRTVMAVLPAESEPMFPDLAVIENLESYRSLPKSWAADFAEPVVVDLPSPALIQEDYLEVVDASDNRVVTMVEILSPSNKSAGKDRKKYETKRRRVFESEANWVEIDLLREGEPMPFAMLKTNGVEHHYRILIKRGDHTGRVWVYPFNCRQPIPIFPLPLRAGDTEPPVQLGKILQDIYDEGGYDMRLNYSEPPEPPLSDAEAQWAAEILRAARTN